MMYAGDECYDDDVTSGPIDWSPEPGSPGTFHTTGRDRHGRWIRCGPSGLTVDVQRRHGEWAVAFYAHGEIVITVHIASPNTPSQSQPAQYLNVRI